MSAADKTKLNGIAEGANKTTVDTTLSATSTNPVQNKVVKDALDKKVSVEEGKGLSSNDYTDTEKTKLGNIDDSLLGVTADQIGKVKDVTVNGTSVLNASGVAAITSPSLGVTYTSVTTSDSAWTTQTINGTVYQAIRLTKTDGIIDVYNSNNQEIVVQKVFDTTYMYICVGSQKIACTIRKISLS